MYKSVIDINTLKIIEVLDSYIECSVCGVYKDMHDYMRDGVRVRTNCVSCYNLDWDDMQSLGKKVRSIKSSVKYRDIVHNRRVANTYFNNSISVGDMISALSRLDKDSRLYVGQDGYYAEGEVADACLPVHDKDIDGVKFYHIGWSSQNY